MSAYLVTGWSWVLRLWFVWLALAVLLAVSAGIGFQLSGMAECLPHLNGPRIQRLAWTREAAAVGFAVLGGYALGARRASKRLEAGAGAR